MLAARRLDRLETLTAELSSKYPSIKIHNLQLDVRTKAAVDAAIASLPAAFAEIAVLVNNAGLTIGVDLVENVPEDVINTIIDTNVKGLLFVSQAVIPGMRQRDRGHIINIGSISGKDVYSGGGIYCGSKFFVDALNKSLTLELLNTKIRVTEISPGMADSDFITVRFGGDESAKDKWYQGFTPLRPKDVGGLPAKEMAGWSSQLTCVRTSRLCGLCSDEAGTCADWRLHDPAILSGERTPRCAQGYLITFRCWIVEFDMKINRGPTSNQQCIESVRDSTLTQKQWPRDRES